MVQSYESTWQPRPSQIPNKEQDRSQKFETTLSSLLSSVEKYTQAAPKEAPQAEYELRNRFQAVLLSLLEKRLFQDHKRNITDEDTISFAEYFDKHWAKAPETGVSQDELLALFRQGNMQEAIMFGQKEILFPFFEGKAPEKKTLH